MFTDSGDTGTSGTWAGVINSVDVHVLHAIYYGVTLYSANSASQPKFSRDYLISKRWSSCGYCYDHVRLKLCLKSNGIKCYSSNGIYLLSPR